MADDFDLKGMVKEMRDDAIASARMLQKDFGIDTEMSLYKRLTHQDFEQMMSDLGPDATINYIMDMETKRIRR